MYKIIKKGEEYNTFNEDVVEHFYSVITEEISKMLSEVKDPKDIILGAFALHDIPLKKGGIANVWIEYNAKIISEGMVDAGVHECVIYDGIPDFVLDKYIKIKNRLE